MSLTKTLTAGTAFALALIAGITAAQHNASDPSATSAEKAVLARLADIQRAAEALQPEKVFSYVLENDKGALAQNGKLFQTRQEALESTKEGFQGLKNVEYSFDQQHVTLLSPTVALATAEGLSSATTSDGRTFSTRFAQSVVFILTNGQWQVFHAHRSFPPAR